MAIKWSAVKVSEEMDKAEKFIKDAETPLRLAKLVVTEAKARAVEARQIPNLPLYIMERLNRLTYQIERMDNVKSAIESVRDSIPEGAIEAEYHRGRHGSQQSLV